MTSFLDTSVAVRYLTGDPPSMYEDAIRIVEGVDELFFTDSAIAETGHVLDSFYHVARADIVDSLMTLLQHRNIRPFGLDKALVLQGLLMCRPSGRVSIPDALIWAAARSAHDGIVYSFDRRFPSDGIAVRRSFVE